jgi:threonine dehydratase
VRGSCGPDRTRWTASTRWTPYSRKPAQSLSTLQTIREHVNAIITVSEQGIRDALLLVWERMKIVIEPSAAVPIAALFEHPDVFRGQGVGVILSGGNVDVRQNSTD